MCKGFYVVGMTHADLAWKRGRDEMSEMMEVVVIRLLRPSTRFDEDESAAGEEESGEGATAEGQGGAERGLAPSNSRARFKAARGNGRGGAVFSRR